MTLRRRRFLQLAGASLVAAPHVARAQGTYPTRPVRMIVGQAPGSATDIVGRLVAQSFQDHFHQQFVVEARPGAGGNIATDFVVHQPGDGYTLAVVNSQNTINMALYEKLNFDFQKDIAPIGRVESVPLVMVVNPSLPVKTVAEFIAYAKANPGKLNMASAGIGGPQHIAGELFKFMADVNMTHVPYKGTTPAITDLIGGQVQVMFDVTVTAMPQIKGGKLRALGATTLERLPFLPDVPTIDSVLKGYECTAWIGVGAPKGTPKDIIVALNKQTNAMVLDATFKKRIEDLGALVAPPNTPEQFAQYITENIEKWRKVIKFAGIKPI